MKTTKQRTTTIITAVGTCGGLVAGGLTGFIVVILSQTLFGEIHLFKNLWVIVVAGAAMGAIVGFRSPRLGIKLLQVIEMFG